MKKKMLLFCSLLGSLAFSQQISLDTSLVSDIPNTIDEWWYWSGGFPVIGKEFTPNTDVIVRAIDPNGKTWRNFTGTSDGNGNFSIQITSKETTSIYGDYIIEAYQKNGNKATEKLTVKKRDTNIINVSASPNSMSLSDFLTKKIKINATGFEPNAEVTVINFSPNEIGSQLEPSQPFGTFEPKYANANGEFETEFNINTYSYPWGEQMPEVNGLWRVNLISNLASSRYNPYGIANFRILPDNPSKNNYCDIVQTQNATSSIEVTPITYFSIEGINENSSNPNSTIYYEDFTNINFDLQAGKTYKATIKGINNSTDAADTFTLFIDWNQNGILDDENEIIHEAYILGSDSNEIKISEFEFTVPKNAVNGNTRLRILKVNSLDNYSLFWPIGSCGFYTNDGQVEDYTINVTNGIDLPNCKINCPEDITVVATEGVDNAVVNYELNYNCDQVNGNCETSYPSNNFEIGLGNSQFRLVANDFDIPEGKSVKISKIIPNFFNYSYGVNVKLYKDNKGKPGELINSFNNIQSKSQTEIGEKNGQKIYEVTIDLPKSIELSSGKYWISINAEGPAISWESTSKVTTATSLISTNNGETWISQEGTDGVFKIIYECEQDPFNETDIVLISGLPSGSKFPVGDTTVIHNLVYNGVTIDTCTFVVTVKENTLNVNDLKENKVTFFPNPVKDILNISYHKNIENINIYNVNGEKVYTKKINSNSTQLNLSKLISGFYIVKAETKEGIKTFKIIKK